MSEASTAQNHELEPYFGKVDPQYERMLAEDVSGETDTFRLRTLAKTSI